MTDPTMTPDELEQERAELLAILATEAMTDDLRRRIAAVAAADAAQPRTAFEQAMFEVLQETVALLDRTLPPGLDVRRNGEMIEVVSGGQVVGTVNRSALLEREAQIAAAWAAEARHEPN